MEKKARILKIFLTLSFLALAIMNAYTIYSIKMVESDLSHETWMLQSSLDDLKKEQAKIKGELSRLETALDNVGWLGVTRMHGNEEGIYENKKKLSDLEREVSDLEGEVSQLSSKMHRLCIFNNQC